tara:strand:- start:295 stop:1149 length:855 start_codon:yes stop_codon:yes gene_type:complete
MTVAKFRLDWRREHAKLTPIFRGEPCVVRIGFQSEDAAVDKFNYLIKEEFQNANGNGQHLSARIDDAWSTTHTINDQIDAVARKLEEAGISIDWSQTQSGVGDVASGNQTDGDLDIDIANSVIINGMDASAAGVQKRLNLVCEGMRQFVANGGRFLLVVNDMDKQDQGKIWKAIWNAGLREAGGDRLSLVYYVGPKCGQEPHDDAPDPNVAFKLPHDIEADDTRQDEVYDDVVGILTDRGYSAEEAVGAAKMLVDSNSDSVRRLHMGLSKALMNWPMRKGVLSS